MSSTERWQELAGRVGELVGTSTPEVIDQARVDQHAQTTGDAQWIHNDPDRARRESPFGGPVVQGFLLLSLLTRLSSDLRFPEYGPVRMLVNYGFDRVRFVRTVPVGAAVRLHAVLSEVRPRGDGSAVLELGVTLSEEGAGPDPAVAARWLFLAVPGDDGT